MLKAVSTHVFLRQRLHPGLLDCLARSGADAIELFAARQHFDYTSRTHISEIAEWFRSNPVTPFSLHAPLFPDTEMGLAGAPAVNVVHVEKTHRIDAMDEIKRAIEVAEQIPLRYVVIHLGERDDEWSERTLDYAMTALEHLRAFANPLGVKLNVENLQSELTQPEHLLEILRAGHFSDIGVCFDVGHAHLGSGVATALDGLKGQIRSAHLHDNHGEKDEHLWPSDGTIEWGKTMDELRSAPKLEAGVLEINYTLDESPETVATKARATFERLEAAHETEQEAELRLRQRD
jgi:sugar phosphate isomerase/epimerase